MIQLDTHVVVWLYVGETKRIAPAARRLIEANDVGVSPIVLLELEFLREIGRTRVPSAEVLAALAADIGLAVADISLAKAVAAATLHPWTRDPFDRLIVASASALGHRLLTADRSIRKHFAGATWG